VRVRREYLPLLFNVINAVTCSVRVFGIEVFVYDVLGEELSLRNPGHPVLRLSEILGRLPLS